MQVQVLEEFLQVEVELLRQDNQVVQEAEEMDLLVQQHMQEQLILGVVVEVLQHLFLLEELEDLEVRV
jgi:hypothetical protein